MNGWKDTVWGEICSLSYGKAIRGYQDKVDGIPVYGTNGRIGYYHQALQFEPGIIIGRKGAYRGVHYSPDPFFVIDTAFALRPKKGLDARWGYYRLLLADINSMDSGSAIPSTSRNEFYAIPVAVPPLPEQREIAATLGALDDKIELNRKTAATLEEMARALYRSWFVDFDPVHAKAEGSAPAHMDAQTAALFPDRFAENGLPEGWLTKRLGDILVLHYGKALKKEFREKGPYRVYGSGGSDSTHTEALIKKPTIIIGRKGSVGSIFWEPNGCWPIDTVFYVTSGFPISFVLRTIQNQPLSEMNTDAAVPGLNRENVYRLDVVTSDFLVMNAFDRKVSLLQQMIDALLIESQTLTSLRDTLLPRLMSGELRVPAARKLVEEAL